jgi:hypothetical protein
MGVVGQHPEIIVRQLGLLIATTRGNNSEISDWERTAASISFNDELSRLGGYQWSIGINLGFNTPLGGISASYNLDPIIANIFRGMAGKKTPDEIKQTLQSVALMNPEVIAGLGRTTWDAWNNTGGLYTGELQKLHSMYDIVSQSTSSVPSPDAEPSAYIDTASPFVTPLYYEIMGAGGVDDRVIRQDWEAFIRSVQRVPLTDTDPDFGTKAVRTAVANLANSPPSEPTLAFRAFSKALEGKSVSIDPSLSKKIQQLYADETKFNFSSQSRSFDEIQAEWREVQEGIFAPAYSIALAFNDQNAQRAILATQQITKMVYSVKMVNAAQRTLQSGIATLGIVGAVVALFDEFSKQAPTGPSPEALILQGQVRILSAISQVSSQIRDVALTLASIQRQLGEVQRSIDTDFAIERKELHAIEAALSANRADFLDAVASSMEQAAKNAASQFESDATTPEVVSAARRRDPRTLQSFNTNAAPLFRYANELPFISPFLVPSPLLNATPNQVLTHPWNFAEAVEDHIIESAEYYQVADAPATSRWRVRQDALENLKALRYLKASRNFGQAAEGVGNLDVFHDSIALIADTLVRFPGDLAFPTIDVSSLMNKQRLMGDFLKSVVGAEPIINLALVRDLDQLQRHWDTFSLLVIGTLYPISGAGGLDDRALRDSLISESRKVFVDVHCAIDVNKNCDFSEKEQAIKKLIGMNIIMPAPQHHFYDLTGGVQQNPYLPSNGCANVGTSLEWTSYARKYQNSVEKYPDGVLIDYRQVCATFFVPNSDPDYKILWGGNPLAFDPAKPIAREKLLERYLEGAIAAGQAKVNDIPVPIQGDHRRRLESSATAAGEIVDAERKAVDESFHEYANGDTRASTDLKLSLNDIVKDSASLQFIAQLSRPECFKETWDAQLSHLLSMTELPRPESEFIGKKLNGDFSEKGILDVGSEVQKLLRLKKSDYLSYFHQQKCYLAPAEMIENEENLQILEVRQR